jgi:hypothetical protein
MSDTTYVAITEDEWNFCVGDMETITEWLHNHEIVITGCSFYELGKKVEVVLKVAGR